MSKLSPETKAALRAFHKADIWLPGEREEYRRVSAALREFAVVVVTLFIVVCASSTAAYGLGRHHESELTISALSTAEYTRGLLAQCVEASAESLEYIRAYDAFLAAQIARRRRLVPLSYTEDR